MMNKNKKKIKASVENGLLNAGAIKTANDIYDKLTAKEEQHFPASVKVSVGREECSSELTEEVLNELLEGETSGSSSKIIDEFVEKVRNTESLAVDEEQKNSCAYSLNKDKQAKKKSHAPSPKIEALVEGVHNLGNPTGMEVSHNRTPPVKKAAPAKQKVVPSSKTFKKLSVNTSGEIANRFKEYYHMKVMGDTLYVFNGDYYVAENRQAIIRRIKLCLTDDERLKLPYSLFEEAVKQLESDPFILLEKKPDNSGCVLFDNGMFDIRTGKRESFRPPERFYIYKVHANYLGYKVETPVFDSFLEDISGGWNDVKRLILTFIGYCLLPDLDAKCFFILGTAPDSGKSIILKLLERLIGEEVVSNSTLHGLERQFGMSNITGKMLNVFGDLPRGRLKDNAVSNIKALTGDDKVPIDKKYKDEISYRNMAKFVFATNHPIQLKEEDDAFWERMVIVPFAVSIPKEDQNKNLLEDLWEERDGIVSKAMYFARKLIENNYIFPECYLSTKMKNEWSNATTTEVMDFIRQWCVLSDYTAKTSTDTLYDAYLEYCGMNRLQPKRIEDFSHALRKNYKLPSIRMKDGIHYLRGYQGIKLKSQGGDCND